ncbi:hypothetical protein [Saccharothrix variisporea]|uniref:Uncharacterized protein n=1 Tax=Saccharothrix variisporea TaxID=543527 RepID=A0A495X1M0_9PSEU|nr:hypothetical protein [Saccharothrix variisporea]RKT67094.1 hypothetical protein DFJ66_0262 [Saccharothrix variisporea]
MALLDATNRLRVWAQSMRDWPGTLGGVTKAQLQAAVDATDQWIEDNQTSYNNALPVAFRSNATLAQKTFLFCYVAMRRAGRLRAQED